MNAAATDPASGPDPLGDFLHDGLAAVAAPAGMASADDLAALWAQLFPGQDGATRAGLRTFQAAFQTAVAAGEDEGAAEEALHLGGGGWEVDLRGGLVRTALATAFIAGVLAASGVTGLLPLVAPAVLPLLFDVRQVRLKPSQEIVLAELRLSPEARSGGLTADELYARLAPQTQRQLSRLDFADFLDQVRRAGLADPGDSGRLVLRPPDDARLKISIG
jgi:hypothetical protein